jgi:predicted methyltransferase
MEIPENLTDFDTEIKNLYISLQDAAQSLLRHLLCELDGDRFGFFTNISRRAYKITEQAKKIEDETERTLTLERLEKFRRESAALVVTLGGLVKQAGMPRERYQKLLRTIKEL